MWGKIKKLTDIALIAGFLGFIYLVLVMTYTGPVQKAVEDARLNFGSYMQLSEKFEEILQKNLYKKYGFINFNGRIMRILRVNSLNERQKLANGFLTRFDKEKDISKAAKNIIELNKFLADRNVFFLYILVPNKNSMYDVQFAPGYGDESYKSIDSMINTLEKNGIKAISMNAWFEENGWHMQDAFWKTDHHWRPRAGLAAARCTMDLLQKERIAEYDRDKLEDESYRVKVLRNWFLGSSGKRTGKNYAGVDNIAIYYPKFKTNYSYAGLHAGGTNWSYSDKLLNEGLMKHKNYFETDPHSIYLYGDLPLQIIHNAGALNNKKLLIVGESFRRIWQYFISTQFQEIHSIDSRSYRDGSFVQYVEEIKPDIVIMCINSWNVAAEDITNFGVKEYRNALKKSLGQITNLGDIEFHAEDKNNKFEVVCSNLEPNQTYTLTIDNAELSGVKDSFVQMTLQNMSENKAIYNRYFDVNSRKSQKWIFTTPEKAEDTYGIYLYAGTKGHTANISVKIDGIRLRKGIFEQ